jgi:methionyl-tRNA formyltransferase
MRVVLVGEEAAGLRVMREILDAGHELVAVLTSAPREGRPPPALWHQAQARGLRLLPPARVADAAFPGLVRAERVELLLNVHSLVVLPEAVLAAPRQGCFNLHPGPLPEYAGLNTVSWAIYQGERDYGVTLHRMSPRIDAGEIASLARLDIGDRDTALSVYAKCLTFGLPLVAKLLRDAAEGSLQLTPQDLRRRRYFGRGVPENGRISWQNSARQIHDFVRACDYAPFPSPWGHPLAMVRDRTLAIARSELAGPGAPAAPGTVGEVGATGALVACGDGWLRLRRLLVEGRPALPTTLLRQGDVLRTP